MIVFALFGSVAAMLIAGIVGSDSLVWVVGAMTPFAYIGGRSAWDSWQDERWRQRQAAR